MKFALVTLTLLVAFALAPAASAQPSIDWSTIDSGSGQLSGGSYTISGTIAQPDASAPLTGGAFALTGGFWPGVNTCRADFDNNGTVAVPDIFAFLSTWFAQGLGSDFDNDGTVAVPDIFAFLSAWFSGCL